MNYDWYYICLIVFRIPTYDSYDWIDLDKSLIIEHYNSKFKKNYGIRS